MSRQKFLSGVLGLAVLWLANTGMAYEIAVEFSADAVQKSPARPDYRARMFVSKDAVRTESMMNNVKVVEIINSKNGTYWLLIPEQKLYLEQQRGPTEPARTKHKSANATPCAAMPNTKCRLLSKETINQRQTEKWEFSVERDGQQYRSLHWIDVERKMPVREFFPDGTLSELQLVEMEMINQRKTEKWIKLITGKDGRQSQSTQWYDPELKLAIREELPGGFFRELNNIKVGKQDKKNFRVPADYIKTDRMPENLLPGYAHQ